MSRQCGECGTKLARLSRKHETSEGLLCHVCFSTWRRETIAGYARKYLSRQDDLALTRIETFYGTVLRSRRGDSLESIRDAMTTYRYALQSPSRAGLSVLDIDETITRRELVEWSLEFLRELESSPSRDQGADLIVSKGGGRTVIQAKFHNGRVSNKAVQEVVAARAHYGAEKAMVVTNSSFTKSAIELALSNDVELWDGGKLRQVVRELESRGEEPIATEEFVSEKAKKLESRGFEHDEAIELIYGMAEELEKLGVEPSYGREFIESLVETYARAEPRTDEISIGLVEDQQVYPVKISCPGCGETFTHEIDVTKEIEADVECPHCGWGLTVSETARKVGCRYCSQVYGSLEEAQEHESECEMRPWK